jgi:RES domain-containing protein
VICYRFASFATPLRAISARQPGRFNRGDEESPTQYLSLHPLGPLAELMRNADIRTPEQIRAVQTRTWTLEVPLDDLTEITFDNALDVGIDAAQLVADDRTACQELAAQLRGQVPGIIAPSAALPGTRNVIVFGPRVAAPYLTTPVSAIDVPASITAKDARPLTSLLDVMRFIGDSHRALDAWQRGRAFRVVEPDWAVTREKVA